MELLLSRHARKLLTAHSLRDLGRFSAHLDFPLPPWLTREGQRAAKVEDFPFSLQQLHREFQWPLPLSPPTPHHQSNNKGDSSPTISNGSLFSPASTIRDHTPTVRDHTPKDTTTPTRYVGSEGDDSGELVEESMGGSAIRRPHRPPNLDLSPSKTGETEQQHNVTLEPTAPMNSVGNEQEFDPAQSSTPTRAASGSISERISLIMKKQSCMCVCACGLICVCMHALIGVCVCVCVCTASLDLNVENSSLGDILEESDWELNSEVTTTTGAAGMLTRGSPRAEKEIRYVPTLSRYGSPYHFVRPGGPPLQVLC